MELLFFLLCSEAFPGLSQNIGLACLTILIPVGLAIFSADREFAELDNHVILDHVVRAKWLLPACALIFLPVLFWNYSSIDWRFVELVLWGLGIWLLIYILYLSYRWLKGNKFPLRFDYLQNVARDKDLEESWRSVWNSADLTTQREKQFFDIFAANVDRLLRSHE